MPIAPALKILLVDDHAALRRTIRQMFDGALVTFFEASSGEEAIVVYQAERPDWVIMDMRMPGIGGLKATESIRNLDQTARVIMISQFTDPEYREQARRVGVLEFVDKEEMAMLPAIIGGYRPGAGPNSVRLQP